MKKAAFIILLSCLFSLGASAQNKSTSTISPTRVGFKSDLCTLFPDGDYFDCCIKHDWAYDAGGSWTMRWRADKKLFKCVAKKRGWHHKIIAPIMWAGVRIGGVAWLPTPFRWGFGQKNLRKSPKRCENECKKILTAK